MDFFTLILNISPLYGIICVGFALERAFNVTTDAIATLMIYAVIPFVMCGAAATIDFKYEHIVPPLIISAISVISSSLAYISGKMIWGITDRRANLFALLGVSSNATYFGIPIVMSVFSKEWISIYMLMVFPLFLLDCTLSYYYGLRGSFSAKESVKNLSKMPVIYGALAGIILNAMNIELPHSLMNYRNHFSGTMVTLGALMIGISFSKMRKFSIDFSFVKSVFCLRYLLWPLLGIVFIYLDKSLFHCMDVQIYTLILLICSCPLAANTVAYSEKLDLYPKLTAFLVISTTVLAIFFIPFLLWIGERYLF